MIDLVVGGTSGGAVVCDGSWRSLLSGMLRVLDDVMVWVGVTRVRRPVKSANPERWDSAVAGHSELRGSPWHSGRWPTANNRKAYSHTHGPREPQVSSTQTSSASPSQQRLVSAMGKLQVVRCKPKPVARVHTKDPLPRPFLVPHINRRILPKQFTRRRNTTNQAEKRAPSYQRASGSDARR